MRISLNSPAVRPNRFTGTTTPASPMWGEALPGVKTRLLSTQPVMALTFDACGSASDGVDTRIIQALQAYRVPATLFLSGRWMAKYPQVVAQLAQNPLFEIENHGLNHRPASVQGNSAYGIAGTQNPAELYQEVDANAQTIAQFTGKRPRFFRSGTAYYDPAAIQWIQSWGHQPVGYSVLGDAGATYSRHQVKQALLNAPHGGISLMHMNHPERDSGNGLLDALPELIQRGWRFVQLQQLPLL